MRRAGAAALVLACLPLAGALAQQRPARPQPASNRCRLEIVNIDREGTVAAGTNYYGGGNVHLRCVGQQVDMRSDSIAYFGGGAGRPAVVQFIGSVIYRDTALEVKANRATYYQDGERWEARQNVRTRNLKTGSTLTGPSLDYFKAIAGVRDTAEMFATGRPTINYATKDSAGAPGEPYVIVGDRVRMRGEEKVWAGGKVTIDRSDLSAAADSLRLFSGDSGSATLVGGAPRLKGLGRDTFELRGQRIDLALASEEVTGVVARGTGRAVTKDLTLDADTIDMALADEKVERTLAWGTTERPRAVGEAYEVRADSLAIDTPGQRLQEVRGFGNGWMGAEPDTATTERDWIAGDTVRAVFVQQADSAGGDTKARIARLEATAAARSFYRGDPDPRGRRPLNYARAERIVARMKTDEPKGGVEKVELTGNVDGIQLEPDDGAPAPRAVPSPAPGREAPE